MLQTIIDTWAAIMAALACVALGVRANMLKPRFVSWNSAPPPVFLALAFQAIVAGCCAYQLLRGGHANLREAAFYTAAAVVGWVLLWNLDRQRHEAAKAAAIVDAEA